MLVARFFFLFQKCFKQLCYQDHQSDRIHSSLTAVCCFNNGYVGKQPVAWKEYSAEYWLKVLQESMSMCTGRHDITEILLKTALNTIKSIFFRVTKVGDCW